ncbi:hypothetical protein O181_092824 [Austropuccinia psidii MF-1]|uniref:Uncharacterized protein n=1 Tax=Austropuccinia psidii MF-1 TaxID=1389203 RepID=A0A9Q3J017_9BASI|nr:hypothetical protein [Austropuccinia psidii MF-1]
MGAIGGLQEKNGPPGPNFAGDLGMPWDHKLAHGLDPLRGSRTINILASSKFQGGSWVMNSAPKGSSILTLEALRGAIIGLWPHFLEVIDFNLQWTDSDVLNLLLAYFLVMSYKLTELTESSPSATPPSVLCGSGILSQLASPSMASSGHFNPSQTYDGYKAVEALDPACTECLAKGKDCFQHYNPQSSKCHYCFIGKKPCRRTWVQASNVRRYLWSRKDVPFGKEFPVSEAPTPDGTSGFSNVEQVNVARWTNSGGPIPVGGRPIYYSSEVPISRINTEGVVKRIRRIADFPPDPDAAGSDELDGEEVEVVPHSVGHPSITSSSQPLAKRFHGHIIPSTPRNFQHTLAAIPTSLPPASPSPSHARPALNQELTPSPIQQPRNSPIITSQHLQPMASSRRRRDGFYPLPFPAAQVFQRRDCWPIQATREDPNTANKHQEAVARLFRRVDRNSKEVIMYANDRIIPGTASEEMAAKFAWYEDELINDLQRTFDDFGRDN